MTQNHPFSRHTLLILGYSMCSFILCDSKSCSQCPFPSHALHYNNLTVNVHFHHTHLYYSTHSPQNHFRSQHTFDHWSFNHLHPTARKAKWSVRGLWVAGCCCRVQIFLVCLIFVSLVRLSRTSSRYVRFEIS